jgi:hypothetical protein
MVHELPAARLAPQVVVRVKSAGLVPVMVMLVMLNAPVPAFLRVTAVPALVEPSFVTAKATDVGDSVTAGAVPVPVRATAWGLFTALSVMVKLADLAPVAVGVNVTLMVQLAAAAKLAPQLFVWAKSPLLLPVTVMLVRVNVAVPLFLRVIALAALVVDTN